MKGICCLKKATEFSQADQLVQLNQIYVADKTFMSVCVLKSNARSIGEGLPWGPSQPGVVPEKWAD